MYEAIFIGDVHAVPAELDECQKLLGLWRHIRSEHPSAPFIFLGDQTDRNDALSVRVMGFWRHVAQELGNVVFMVGNHDQVFAGSDLHAMDACRDVAWVEGGAGRLGHTPFWLVAYCGDAEEWERRTARQSGVLICHQDLAGAVYDDGVRPTKSTLRPPSSFELTISGHLHTPQEFGSIWYPGSPRWRHAPDAHVVERAVWWAEFDDHGRLLQRRAYPTSGVCQRLVRLRDTEEVPATLEPGAQAVVEVRGSPEYVARRRRELATLGARVRGIPEVRASIQVRESEGLEASMRTHLATFQPPNGTSPERLRALIQQRMGVIL